mgnify:CR=1 FL=1
MKVLLTTVMAFGFLFLLGANQSTEAVVAQPVEPIIHQDHVVPAYWHRWHRGLGMASLERMG